MDTPPGTDAAIKWLRRVGVFFLGAAIFSGFLAVGSARGFGWDAPWDGSVGSIVFASAVGLATAVVASITYFRFCRMHAARLSTGSAETGDEASPWLVTLGGLGVASVLRGLPQPFSVAAKSALTGFFFGAFIGAVVAWRQLRRTTTLS